MRTPRGAGTDLLVGMGPHGQTDAVVGDGAVVVGVYRLLQRRRWTEEGGGRARYVAESLSARQLLWQPRAQFYSPRRRAGCERLTWRH